MIRFVAAVALLCSAGPAFAQVGFLRDPFEPQDLQQVVERADYRWQIGAGVTNFEFGNHDFAGRFGVSFWGLYHPKESHLPGIEAGFSLIVTTVRGDTSNGVEEKSSVSLGMLFLGANMKDMLPTWLTWQTAVAGLVLRFDTTMGMTFFFADFDDGWPIKFGPYVAFAIHTLSVSSVNLFARAVIAATTRGPEIDTDFLGYVGMISIGAEWNF